MFLVCGFAARSRLLRNPRLVCTARPPRTILLGEAITPAQVSMYAFVQGSTIVPGGVQHGYLVVPQDVFYAQCIGFPMVALSRR